MRVRHITIYIYILLSLEASASFSGLFTGQPSHPLAATCTQLRPLVGSRGGYLSTHTTLRSPMDLLVAAHARLAAMDPLLLALSEAAAVLLLRFALSTFKFAARWIVVGFGTRSVPTAPEGNWLLGHVIPLARNCAWEKMYEWVGGAGSIVKFRILHRTGVVVGDPLGVKRIFQVRAKDWGWAERWQRL